MSDAAAASRILVLASTSKDAANTSDVLNRAGLAAEVCRDMETLCREIGEGVGGVMLNVESLAAGGAEMLQAVMREQPDWSDIPFIVLTPGGRNSPAALHAMELLGNVIILERPVRVSTFVAAARTALRDRERQYVTRGHLAELQEADRRKNEFLAMLAHELRNPLAPIRNAMQILNLRGSDEAGSRWAREVVERQVTHLTRLVDDLLDVSRITRGSVTLKTERVQIATLISRAVETSRPLIDSRRQNLAVEVDGEDGWIEGDLTRLVQAVSNLLNNASKYTPEGGNIGLDVERLDRAVEIRVWDDGIGIPRHMLGSIFELFTQVETSLDRSQGGLGIGLTLVKSIVEMHGGTIRAHSAGPGRGSEFVIELPLSEAVTQPATDDTTEPKSAIPTCRVLVVDDNFDAAASLEILLQQCGYDVRTAEDGHSALELVASFRPQVVVLDIGLPGMDGYEVAARVCERHKDERPVLIALSGYGGEESRRRAREAGFDHSLTKPADFDALKALLASSLQAAC
jgi:signal transduction histidine kinase/ActR/RegA family two-component response regulator